LFAVEDASGVPLIVMEYLPNGTLAQRIRAGLPPAEAMSIVHQVLAAIAASHAGGVVHGDIKPANILFSETGIPKVADFGMARYLALDEPPASTPDPRRHKPDARTAPPPAESQSTGPSMIAGTPAYMAPEQTLGSPPTAAADVFSAGLLVYEIVTGRRAVRASGPTDALQRVRELDAPSLAAELPDAIQDVFRRMLAPEPGDRPTAAHAAAAVRRSA
jgi:serine/threonine-protein kinase